ncbi:MAG: hypothetical protein N3B12_04260 [Armatimonadetes bacterium]|nr:hypothetical protein [Armatimonadota bacterium]
MGKRFFCLLSACCIAVLGVLTDEALAARTVKGTLVSAVRDSVTIKQDGDGNSLTFKIAPNANILRGQVGRDSRKATTAELGAGDRIVAVVNDKGFATSIKAYYVIAKGTILSIRGDKVFFRDGRSVKLRPGMPVVLESGKVGKVADLTPASEIVCRVNPVTGEAWTVIAKLPKSKSSTVAPYKPKVTLIKPVIKSVTYKAPENLKARDWMKVELTGTPGGRAVCQVKGLIPRTEMKETAPGVYVAHVMIPAGKGAKNEPLVGYLTVNGLDAAPVQASKLITVDVTVPERVPPPVVAVTPEPEPVSEEKPVSEVSTTPAPEQVPESVLEPTPAPVELPKPEPPKVKAPVVIKSPEMGARIQRAINVIGTAEPGSNVIVTVSYSNQRGGILNLSGQVSSQLVAVGPDGVFKMGPIPLEGPLATRGLIFTVKASYPDAIDQAVLVSVFGERS